MADKERAFIGHFFIKGLMNQLLRLGSHTSKEVIKAAVPKPSQTQQLNFRQNNYCYHWRYLH